MGRWACIAFAIGLYHWIFEAELIVRAGELTDWDMVVGIASIALVFEAARRMMGIALPLICAIFLAYGLFGQYLPGAAGASRLRTRSGHRPGRLRHRGHLRTPIYVSSTYIFLFILFGSFLEQAGMIKLFTDFALGLFGRSQGGPAKVCGGLVGADGHDQRLGRGERASPRASSRSR